jgi:hypothetical protein
MCSIEIVVRHPLIGEVAGTIINVGAVALSPTGTKLGAHMKNDVQE